MDWINDLHRAMASEHGRGISTNPWDGAAFQSSPATAGLKFAEQQQDQQNDNHKTKTSATVIASTLERTATHPTEAAQQRDDQND